MQKRKYIPEYIPDLEFADLQMQLRGLFQMYQGLSDHLLKSINVKRKIRSKYMNLDFKWLSNIQLYHKIHVALQ